MKTALWPLQEAIFQRLKNDAKLINAGMNGVYDFAEEGTAAPYITIGDDTANDWGTKTWNGEDITVTLHSWSDGEGKKEAKQLIDLALQAMTESPLTVTGFEVDSIQRDFINVMRDPAGGYHGVMRMRLKIKEGE